MKPGGILFIMWKQATSFPFGETSHNKYLEWAELSDNNYLSERGQAVDVALLNAYLLHLMSKRMLSQEGK